MKYKSLLFLTFSFFCRHQITMAQGVKPADPVAKTELKQYFFVMLIAGTHRNQDSASAAKIQEGHMSNIRRLAQLGKIIVAGPFADEGNWKGIFIFDCETKQQVEEYLQSDPAIASGRLGYEIHPWWTVKNCVFK